MKQEQLVNLPIDWKRGSGLRKSDLDKDGKNKCILYGELYTKHKNVLIESCNISRTNKIGVVYSNKGDVLVPGTSTASKEDMLLAREIDEDGVFLGGDINIIRPKQGIFAKKYLPYFFETFTAYDQLDRYITGATGIIHLSNTGLKNLKVPLPTFQEQQRIVSILDETFAAIAKAKANAEQNLINAKELFENYLQGVFENSGKDWRDKSLGEVCEYDKTPNKKSLPYVGLEHIESNSGKFIGELKQFKVKSSTFYFNQEHVLYGRLRPYLNKVLLPTFEGHCSTEIFPIKCKNGLDRGFLFHWLIAKETMTKINATWTGARMPRANMNVVLEFKIPVPPLKEQQIIVQKLDALKIETKKLENIYQQKINDLEELKKSILQKAFSGELTATMPKPYVKDEPFLPVAAEPVVTYKRASGLNDDEWLQLYFILLNIAAHSNKPEEKFLAEVKMEKSCHFAENTIKALAFNRRPFKEMNGPADFSRLYRLHAFAKANNIFQYDKHASFKKYSEGENFLKYFSKASAAFRPFIKEVNKLIKTLLPINTNDIDIYATTYAAWNNLLILKNPISIKAIATEGRWHEKKNRFTESDFEQAIEFLNSNNLKPTGQAVLVQQKK